MRSIVIKLNQIICALFLASLMNVAFGAAAQSRPNLIFILTDDLRWNALGCMGDNLVQTPNLDRLAKQGVTFKNTFATTSICCVSRASIFTGQYERRHGISKFTQPLSDAQWAETYPAQLRAAGYRTGFIGKFGVGGAKQVSARAAAFDFWRGLPGGGGEYFIDPKDPTQTHATAKFGGQALEFIAGGKTNPQPFCLSLSFSAPHARDGKPREFQPDLRDEWLYGSNTVVVPPTANAEFFARLPEFVQKSEGRRRWQGRFATPELFQRTMRDYLRLVTGIDREVGRIVAELTRRGLADNTVIIFTSDNGWFTGDRGLADKWFMYEESIRLPLIVYDPRLPAGKRGRSIAAMALNIDFAPTLLDLAGLSVPSSMQGRSLMPLVAGDRPADWRTEFFYEHHTLPEIIPPSEGVRTERWSYFRWLKPNPESEELYDLQTDPLAARNLAPDPQYAEALARLRARWEKYQAELQ
jgi:arylsulfatase A-like enzyme